MQARSQEHAGPPLPVYPRFSYVVWYSIHTMRMVAVHKMTCNKRKQTHTIHGMIAYLPTWYGIFTNIYLDLVGFYGCSCQVNIYVLVPWMHLQGPLWLIGWSSQSHHRNAKKNELVEEGTTQGTSQRGAGTSGATLNWGSVFGPPKRYLYKHPQTPNLRRHFRCPEKVGLYDLFHGELGMK